MILIRSNVFQVWISGWSHHVDLSVLLHNMAVAGALETARRFGANGHEICRGCGREIDPETCHCGDATDDHNQGSGHSPVSMGCMCHAMRDADEAIP
jgi:hypothetical protein